MGNLKTSEGSEDDLADAVVYHGEAFSSYKRIIGDAHHRTADARYRLAEHYVRQELYDDALYAHRAHFWFLMLTRRSNLLHEAQSVFGGKACYKPEEARTPYKLGLVHKLEGRHAQAKECFDEARRMYKEVKQQRGEGQSKQKPVENDFNALVTFWSR